MRHPVARTLPVVLLVAWLLPPPAATGDEDVAELCFKKAEKAARAKDYGEAADLYRRALEEHSPYPEAAYGLAVVLEKLGRSEEALAAYLRCRDELAATEKPSRRSRSLGKDVERAVARLGAGYAELQDIDERFVKSCLALGRRYKRGDPAWAKRAFETVLLVDPDNKGALGELERLGDVEGPTEAERAFSPLVTEDSMPNWDPGIRPPWTCTGGVLLCDARSDQGQLNFVKDHLAGTYSLRATFRVADVYGGKRTFGLFFGEKPDRSVWSYVVTWEDELVLRYWKGGDGINVCTKILSGFDISKWHRLQVDVEPGKVACFLDGLPVFSTDGKAGDAFDGTPAMFAQQARVEIKDVGARR